MTTVTETMKMNAHMTFYRLDNGARIWREKRQAYRSIRNMPYLVLRPGEDFSRHCHGRHAPTMKLALAIADGHELCGQVDFGCREVSTQCIPVGNDGLHVNACDTHGKERREQRVS